jgi:hypothetical protein
VARAAAAAQALDIYGLSIAITGDWPEVVEAIGLDFQWFARAEPRAVPDVEVVVERRSPDFDRFGEIQASFVTPRNVVYQDGARTIVDYFGRAVSVLDRNSGRVAVQGEEEHLVHEAAYLFILSRAGEHLDRLGLSRLHALGLVGARGAVAVMLPSGGGKSTLALRALRESRVRLLSEDAPLLDRQGRLHPFPLRIGVNATDAELLPEGQVRRIERMEFHPKVVLNLSAFADHIEPRPAPLRHIVVGRRSLGTVARLEPIPRRQVVGTLLREGVVGVGIYQGMEFVLQRGMLDVAGKVGTALTRSACCAAGLAKASTWRLTLGRDHERNWDALAPLLR